VKGLLLHKEKADKDFTSAGLSSRFGGVPLHGPLPQSI
jgi:hypothetical protein